MNAASATAGVGGGPLHPSVIAAGGDIQDAALSLHRRQSATGCGDGADFGHAITIPGDIEAPEAVALPSGPIGEGGIGRRLLCRLRRARRRCGVGRFRANGEADVRRWPAVCRQNISDLGLAI